MDAKTSQFKTVVQISDNQLSPWSWVLLEKLIVTQLVKVH